MSHLNRDPKLVKRIGAATALELRATGIPYTFAPCIAVCRDPRWGRCYESYSEDPKVVHAMTEIIPGLQGDIPRNSRKGVPYVAGKHKVAACAKHYVGDGGTTKGINSNDTVMSNHGLLSIHMSPYYHSIIKGVSTIMASYSSFNGIKMHANRELITGFLKNTLNFRGFVISDYMGIDQITTTIHENYTYSILAGVGAGIDMIMIPFNYTEFIHGLKFLVKDKFIPMSRIDDAVKRILRVKFTMGLFENPFADYSMVKYLGSKKHKELAREAVRKSLVLLKNGESADEPLIPLPKKSSKILVAGTHANNIGNQCGGWTIQWQGQSGNITVGTTILTAIKNTVDSKTKVVYSENPDAEYVKSKRFSYAIVVVGEPPYSEGHGDSLNLTIPEPGPSIITNVCGSVKCVVVLITGRPVVVQPYIAEIDALVAAWLPGTAGQGVADVLFGDYGFTGKLPRTWFKSVDQLPMNVGDEHYDPLFPLGFGLTTKPVMLRQKMVKAPSIFTRVILFCSWIFIANAEYKIYQDPKHPISHRIKDLMSRMTLEEKIGQMTQIDRLVASSEVVKNYYIGSILSGGGSIPSPMASAKTWIDMVNDFQKGALSTRLKIPIIYGIDAVHGHNNVYKATIFPHNVCRDLRWGRCYESYSEDPMVVRAMTEIVPGLQGDIPLNSRKGVPFLGGQQKVLASAKHFVGDGGTTKGMNENNTVASMHGLLSIHMPAYYDSVIKGVGTVMVSYSSWNGVKMHANRDLITGYLKNKLRFRGFVISDWEGIDRITFPPHANYTYSILTGVNAGIDMIMVPYKYKEFIDGLTRLVKSKYIPMSRIDDAVKRILRVKFTMGLFEHPLADYSMIKYLGHQEHRELAREAVRKSLVLLKNGESADGPLLPLPKKASKILVAGTHADNIGNQCGGWTISWQGQSGNITSGTTILSAIKNTVDSKTKVVYSENPDAGYIKSNKFSYAIVVVGEPPYAETFGDNLNLTIPQSGLDTITNVCTSAKCVVVLITGRPVVIQPYIAQIDALVAAWLPGSEGQGIADVLFGDYGFSGKLPHTWFKTVDQLPMNVGDPHYDPLFPFGYGLTTQPLKAN
ncbi:hypothetical protein BUALT_Bualt09G0108000 [Buddleja alternifolia]|uniref:Beta-glucosidase n=1 Tax=Buddleja alternifolia TaxID=168488 RepID=A0AAV6XA64_9LAMI|nr:hypothetical protein BUALT_Bualt09G0108000 [Buddleja alternifolia]